jgi:hypothetical protein
MRKALIKVFEQTVERIKEDLPIVPLECWNESVLRFVYSRALNEGKYEVKQFPECSRIDLVLHRDDERAVVEFKFFVRAARYDPMDGTKTGWKGGPSPKNRLEFKGSVEKLRDFNPPKASHAASKRRVLKLVVLFYSDPVADARTNENTYDACYGDGSRFLRPLRLRRLASVPAFLANGSMCKAKLFEVVA